MAARWVARHPFVLASSRRVGWPVDPTGQKSKLIMFFITTTPISIQKALMPIRIWP